MSFKSGYLLVVIYYSEPLLYTAINVTGLMADLVQGGLVKLGGLKAAPQHNDAHGHLVRYVHRLRPPASSPSPPTPLKHTCSADSTKTRVGGR